MKLIKVQVKNFRSVEDSDQFDISDLTCLVGKNEAGKSAILEAIYGLNPIRKHNYDKVIDYPRRHFTEYDKRHPNGKSMVVEATWMLDDEDIKAVEEKLGKGCLEGNILIIQNGFGYEGLKFEVKLKVPVVMQFAANFGGCDGDETKDFIEHVTPETAIIEIGKISEPRAAHKKAIEYFKKMPENNPILHAIDILKARLPKFFLTSHYDRMEGKISVTSLTSKKQNQELSEGEKIFLDFLEYAGTSLEDLMVSERLEEETAKCEAASASITDEIFEFWSQNQNISVEIRINAAKPKDPAPFNQGTIVNLRINNSIHRASIPLSERSAGFVWFFSFLSQFKMLKGKYKCPIILLLDEPGLTLHGKAQADLVRYIQERLIPDHQVIYTTHSPFLVPAQHLEQVRVVEDRIIHVEGERRPQTLGTKVTSDILRVGKDTLFPLRGHLGYDISQSLFIAKNTLLVEGPSDILYLQVASEALRKRSREALNGHWAICPSGGIDKLMSFVSLFSGNNLNIVTLCDLAHGDRGKIQRLRESEILECDHVLTTTDFTGKSESDVEDFFEADIFCALLNETYDLKDLDIITPEKLASAKPTPRLVKQAESLFPTFSLGVRDFDHFSPARFLLMNPRILEGESKSVLITLDRFETAFKKINSFIQKF
jgi:predicted ATP-dependent endonuclease of OLD family